MSWLGILSLLPFALLLLAVMIIIVLDAAGGDYEKRKVEEIFSSVYKLFRRPSPLQREIMQEEKEIKKLEAQIADIKRLDDLKRKKNRLFGELGEADYKTRIGNSTEAEKHVIAFVDGMKLPHAFANERKAIEYIEKYYPRGVEIEWKEVGL